MVPNHQPEKVQKTLGWSCLYTGCLVENPIMDCDHPRLVIDVSIESATISNHPGFSSCSPLTSFN